MKSFKASEFPESQPLPNLPDSYPLQLPVGIPGAWTQWASSKVMARIVEENQKEPMRHIDKLANRVVAGIPDNDDDGKPIYKGPILDVVIINMIATLVTRIFTNGGCIDPNPTPVQVHNYLTREPRWFEPFFARRRERAINQAIEDAYQKYLMATGNKVFGSDPPETHVVFRSIRSTIAKLTVADIEAVKAEVLP